MGRSIGSVVRFRAARTSLRVLSTSEVDMLDPTNGIVGGGGGGGGGGGEHDATVITDRLANCWGEGGTYA